MKVHQALIPCLFVVGCLAAPVDRPARGGEGGASVDGGSKRDGGPDPRLDGALIRDAGNDAGNDAAVKDAGDLPADEPDAAVDAAVDAEFDATVDAPRDAAPIDPPRSDAAHPADPPDAAPDIEPRHPIPPAPAAGPAVWFDAVVRERFPHDPTAFTQGLAFVDARIYESTGLRGRSTVRIGRLETGEELRRHALAAQYFGEGLTAVGERLVQVTWQSGAGFVYDRATLAPVDEFAYAGEGWGLAFDGQRLILSDGTARLRFFDPMHFAEIGEVTVRDAGRPVERLNELEFIDGEIFANVWLTDRIARIDPADGRVAAWIDLTGLRPPEAQGGDEVLNGIAWDAAGRRLLVTGKRWPVIYSIRLVRRE
jgi:glutamine cyclotransferase